jgi:putative addiction module CopG family antidote
VEAPIDAEIGPGTECSGQKTAARTLTPNGKLFPGLAMKISLSPDVERLISESVKSGHYKSADEAVRAGLKLLEEREKETRSIPSKGTPNFMAAFETIAKDVPDTDWDNVPADLSKNVDHYLYGN